MPFQGEDREAEAVAVALGELAFAVGLEQQGEVDKPGHRVGPAERLVKEDMQGGRGEPFLSADDMADLHQMVIDDVGQMVGGEVVGALVQHLVVKDAGADGDLSADEVVDLHVAARLDEETDNIGCALGDEAVDLLAGHRQGVAHRHAGRRVILEVGSLGAGLFKFLRCVECDVGFPRVKQVFDVSAIDVAALALLVRAVCATLAHPFVNPDSEPFERLVDIVFRSRDKTLGVGVFDSENHVAAVLAGENVVIQGGTHTSDVERPRGGRGEAHPDFSLCHSGLSLDGRPLGRLRNLAAKLAIFS